MQVNGRKRHAQVDTGVRSLVLQIGFAAIQDRDGAVPVLKTSRNCFPFAQCVLADSAYAGAQFADGTRIAIEIACGDSPA